MLEPITPQEYFDGLEDSIPGDEVKIERSYLVRLVATADISVYGMHAKAYELVQQRTPVQGVFEINNIRFNDLQEDVVGYIWAALDDYLWIAFQLLASGMLRDCGEIVGYLMEAPEGEVEDHTPSLDRTKPLVMA